MNAADTVVKLAEPSSILFAYIGWADFYDGTENVSGNFAWLEDHPIDNSEASAFVADNEYFYCGIGRGALGVARTHVAFVARDPADHLRYGALGIGYAEVHHLKPLASLDALGGTMRLSDLAIVCSNCHAMIHRGGVTRPLPELIPPRPPNQPVNPTAGYAGRGLPAGRWAGCEQPSHVRWIRHESA